MNSSLLLRAEAAPAAKRDAFPTFKQIFPTFMRVSRSVFRWSLQCGRKHWRKFLLAIAALALLHTGFDVYASAVLNGELEKIRAAGEPLTIQDLTPAPLPDAENAALDYEKAVKILGIKVGTYSKWDKLDDLDYRHDPAALREVARQLELNREGIEAAVRGGLKSRARFSIQWKEPVYATLFPYYAHVRGLTTVMHMDAEVRARKGDMAGALRDIRAMYGIANQLSEESVLVGFLVARGIEGRSNLTLARVLESAAIRPEQAHDFAKSLPQIDWEAALVRAMSGERVFAISTFETVRTGNTSFWDLMGGTTGDSPSFLKWPFNWFWRPWLKLDEVYALRVWTRIMNGVGNGKIPAPNDDGGDTALFEDVPRYAVLTRVLMPVFSRARLHRDAAIVSARQREVSLALAVYRSAKGVYPPSLKEAQLLWGQVLPGDLYRNQPFVYRRTGQTYLLYSVGPDGNDDGGQGMEGLNRQHVGNLGKVDLDDITWNSSGRKQ